MGNRSFLYLTSADADTDSWVQVAEANNVLPSLWKVLLAEPATAPAIDHQRVFGDAGTPNISASAQAALERFERLAGFILEDPRTAEVSGLAPYLEAAQSYLRQVVEQWREEHASTPVFSASLDELSWMSSNPQEFIADCLNDFRADWARMEQAMMEGRHDRLEHLLEFNEWHTAFENWNAWAGVFGLCGLSHEFFERGFNEPLSVPFAEFDPHEHGGSLYLIGSCERFKEGSKWGVVSYDEAGERRVVISAEWDRISILEAESERDEEIVILTRDGRKGLAAVAGEHAGKLLIGPVLDEIWFFWDGFAAAQVGDKFGYLRRDGSWLVQPTFADGWDFLNGFAVVQQNERYGYIDNSGAIVIAPQFELAEGFNDVGIALVRKEGRAGLLGRDGQPVLPLVYESVQWSEDFKAWELQTDSKRGLAHADGRVWIEPHWDDLKVLVTDRYISARQKGQCGVLSWQGEVVIAPGYQELRQLTSLDRGSTYFVARMKNCVGLIDENGKWRVPCEHAAIESLQPQKFGRGPAIAMNHIVKIIKSLKPRTVGLFDMQTQMLVVPCEYHDIGIVKLGAGQSLGFIVAKATRRKKESLVGVLHADGSMLIEPQLRWIGEEGSANRKGALAEMAQAMYQAWGSGKAVEAQRAENDARVWIRVDGTIEPHVAKLEREYHAGSADSAQALAEFYRDTTRAEQSFELARLWMSRAAGAEPIPSGRKPSLEAIVQYAWMLDREVGGPRDAVTARTWLERAMKSGASKDARVLRHLGCLLWDEASGSLDHQRGYELFVAGRKLDDAVCAFNQGIGLRDGIGTEVDIGAAIEAFERGWMLGDIPAAFAMLRLLRDRANEQPHYRERIVSAIDALQRHWFRRMDERSLGEACCLIASMQWNGDGIQPDQRAARDLFQQGAEAGDRICMKMLADIVYGNAESPWFDEEEAQRWRAWSEETP